MEEAGGGGGGRREEEEEGGGRLVCGLSAAAGDKPPCVKAAWHECLGRTKRRGARGGRRPRRPAAPRRQKARHGFPVSCPGAAVAPARPRSPPPPPCRPAPWPPETGKRRPRAGGGSEPAPPPPGPLPARRRRRSPGGAACAAVSPGPLPRFGGGKFCGGRGAVPQFPPRGGTAPAGAIPGQKAPSTCWLPSRRLSRRGRAGGRARGGRRPRCPAGEGGKPGSFVSPPSRCLRSQAERRGDGR